MLAGRDLLKYAVLLLAFVVCFLALGIPYWQLPYSEIGLPDTLINAALALVVLCGFALRAGGIASIRAITLILGAAFIGALAGWGVAKLVARRSSA